MSNAVQKKIIEDIKREFRVLRELSAHIEQMIYSLEDRGPISMVKEKQCTAKIVYPKFNT